MKMTASNSKERLLVFQKSNNARESKAWVTKALIQFPQAAPAGNMLLSSRAPRSSLSPVSSKVQPPRSGDKGNLRRQWSRKNTDWRGILYTSHFQRVWCKHFQTHNTELFSQGHWPLFLSTVKFKKRDNSQHNDSLLVWMIQIYTYMFQLSKEWFWGFFGML